MISQNFQIDFMEKQIVKSFTFIGGRKRSTKRHRHNHIVKRFRRHFWKCWSDFCYRLGKTLSLWKWLFIYNNSNHYHSFSLVSEAWNFSSKTSSLIMNSFAKSPRFNLEDSMFTERNAAIGSETQPQKLVLETWKLWIFSLFSIMKSKFENIYPNRSCKSNFTFWLNKRFVFLIPIYF